MVDLAEIYREEDENFEELLLDMLRKRFTDTDNITMDDIRKILDEKITNALFSLLADGNIKIKL